MSEHALQVQVARLLDSLGLVWTAVPNGGKRTPFQGKWMKDEGLKKGVPDILIFDSPVNSTYVGLAIELKNGKAGRVSPEQEDWLIALHSCGWRAEVCRSMNDVLTLLRACYPYQIE